MFRVRSSVFKVPSICHSALQNQPLIGRSKPPAVPWSCGPWSRMRRFHGFLHFVLGQSRWIPLDTGRYRWIPLELEATAADLGPKYFCPLIRTATHLTELSGPIRSSRELSGRKHFFRHSCTDVFGPFKPRWVEPPVRQELFALIAR